jgi:hypothetical protein
MAADPPPQTTALVPVADASLTGATPNTNSGYATSVKVDGNDPDLSNNDVYAALRWDLSSVPAGATVSSATVTLNVTNPTQSPLIFAAFELERAWNEGQVNWNQAANGSSWTKAGAKAVPADRGSQIADVAPTAVGLYTFTVPASVVQGWLNAPSSNNGILIAHSGNSDGIIFDSREGTIPPKLTVNYRPAGADTTPPDATIDSGPSGTFGSASASFTFSSDEGNSAFECRLDGGTFGGCASPKVYSALSDGSHTFSVRATDAAGNTDATPATRTWTVDTSTQGDPVVYAAGDIASCESSGDEATARLLDGLSGPILTLGDHSDDDGTASEFTDCYEPSWGRFKSRTRPTVGNHEYQTPGAAGYYSYFGAAAGDPSKGYYSYDLGDWHVVSLNSMCDRVGGCGSSSPMVTWLKQDLAANAGRSCTLAYFHHPLFNSGYQGNDPKMRPSWDALYAAGADLILSGHQHQYERFAPQSPSGAADSTQGIREIIVGTGGTSHQPLGTIKANSQVRNTNTYGVLKLTLRPDGYDWRFLPEAGKTFADSGSDQCHGLDTTAPTVSSVAPSDAATDEATIANTEASFSENMDPATLTSSTFTLTKQGASQPLAAQVAYDPASGKVTLDPTADLEAATTYTATLKGGPGGAKDPAGNPLAQDRTWSFTTSTQATQIANLNPASDAGLTEFTPNTGTGAASSLRVDGIDPEPNGGDVYAALRWDLSSIPAEATVSSAKVTLNVSDPTSRTFSAYELKRAWNEGQVNWNQAATGVPWATAGAKGATDRGSQIASVSPPTVAPYTFTVPASVVQAWLSAPSSNNGILIAHTTNADGFSFGSREGTTPPKLTLTYTVGPTDTTPPETAIDSGPSGTVGSASVGFTFSSSETGSTFECKLDSGAFSACTSPKAYSSVSDGSHTFQVRATDAAGNVDTTAATRTWSVDTAAPDTTIDTKPPARTNDASPSFGFSSSETGSTFECRLDGGSFTSCASPKGYAGLSEGSHTFSVRATDAAGNADATPATYTWTVDTTAPETTIDSGPLGTVGNTSASFAFSSDETDSTFECKLDAGPYASCTSPKAYSGLSDGSHTFSVRAIDAAGNADATVATHAWSVDTGTPETTIDSKPPARTNVSSATFDFSSDEAGSTFECKLDAGAYASCTSPKAYSGLSEGSHTFSVRATDAAGNVDATPDNYMWTVDTTTPETTIDSGPLGTVGNPSASFAFSSDQAGSTFECKLDAGAYASCTSPKAYSGLSEGSHTFSVRATDPAGNVDATPASRTWSVDTGTPETTIDSRPPARTNVSSATFDFSSDEAGSTFECKLDAGAYASCTSPKAYSGLSEGSHTFSVRATDSAGNADATPDNYTWTVDSTAPDTAIDSGPSGTVGSAAASFEFSSDEAGSTFECKLDGGAFSACASPQAYSGLSDGSHTFSVRAIDAAGNADPTPSTRAWSVDSGTPETTIDSKPPARTNVSSATFAFSTDEAGSTFECKLDGGAFSACASPQAYSGLAEGSHTFSVRATDPAGNVDATPDNYTWTVDATAPDTAIDSGPSGPVGSAAASFTFSSSEAGSTFECKLDAGAYASCTSPKAYSNLAEGSHTFSVKATDAVGNVDATPANRTWSLDTGTPDTAIDSGPSGTAGNTSASFAFSSSETGSTFECKLDAGAYASCTSPKAYSNLAEGSHTFSVKATDAVGNVDATPANRTWTVDTGTPQTTIDSKPPARTNSTSATFAFSSDEAGSTFECGLDGGAFSTCSSPKAYSGLSEGSHTFSVRATDAVGNVDPTPDDYAWTVDTTAPAVGGVTPVDAATGVAATVDATATFSEAMDPATLSVSTFTLTRQGASQPVAAQVSYDAATRKATLNPNVDLQAATAYTATVKGGSGGVKDVAGNPLGADRTWRFTTATPPETTINSGPSGTVNSRSASFTFSSSETGSTFECRLDGGSFSSCTSPKAYSGLSEGSHTFSVRAKDLAGNVDATPASRTWTVSTSATRSLTSTADTRISENASTANYGGATSITVDGDEPNNSGKDVYGLLRWDLSSVPAGSKITSVSITLNVTDVSKDTYQIYALKRPWVEPIATWGLYATGQQWEVAGAKGSLDRGEQVGSVASPKAGTRTFTLTPALAQSWVDDSSTNFGILIGSPTSADSFGFSSRETSTSGNRPQLSITYTAP